MIKRIAGWIVLVPLFVAMVLFALANRQPVAVSFNPLAPADAATATGVPLFLVAYAVLLVGVLLGGIAVWLTQSGHRQRERHWRREAEALRLELEAARRGPAGNRSFTEVADLMDS